MSFKISLLSTSSAFVFAFFSQAIVAHAADVSPKGDLCAVSGINGKISVQGGIAGDNANKTSGAFGASGSLSLPLGCDFGLQFDAGFQQELNNTTFGGVAHAFTRDPNAYLLGVTGGYFEGAGSNVWAVGPEAELYAGRFSLEAWAGFAKVDVNGFGTSNEGFVFADAAYYPIDDLRMSIGATIVGDSRFLRAAMEYQVSDPISLGLNAKIGDDDYVAVNAGLTFYFGGENNKSLIDRHRQDDPRNRLIDIAGVNQSLTTKAKNKAALNTTPAPTTTVVAATTPAPTTTLAAATTPAPTTTLAAETTPAPTTTLAAATTPAPTTTLAAATTPAPTTTLAAATTPTPTTTLAAETTPAPTTTVVAATTPESTSPPSLCGVGFFEFPPGNCLPIPSMD
jgi:hypothetical protein